MVSSAVSLPYPPPIQPTELQIMLPFRSTALRKHGRHVVYSHRVPMTCLGVRAVIARAGVATSAVGSALARTVRVASAV